MNIQDAAKRLIQLGIPGKTKKEAIKSRLVKKDSARVEKALENYVEKMLVRWAYTEGVIQKPERYKDKNGKTQLGKGKTSDWRNTVVEEAAAVWAVRQKWRDIHGGNKKRLSKDKIAVIKCAASVIDERPFAVYTLPRVIGPLLTKHIAAEHIEMNFVSEECDGLDFFPGENNAQKVDNLNKLVVTWVTAVEKVREWKSRGIKAQAAESEWGKLVPAEIDFSQIDPWRVEVRCPWRIDKPACVTLSYFSRSSKNKRREFSRPPFPFQRGLSKSDHNEIVLLDNWVDTREFFTIDVAAGEDYAKAKNAEIERKIQSSRSPVEKMTLKMSQAHIKTWFGV